MESKVRKLGVSAKVSLWESKDSRRLHHDKLVIEGHPTISLSYKHLQ